ncbi:T-complex protein 11 X-linked protein 2 [Echinops telfairi]|uniref:T-complex protein 11 X-linked protein 2 n=1 Tax=Echinops telfairi TaxID=9371 RepID=A0AC55D484_ECHTE|nr:T-complex protein 11 X-linked protein 2 [Echinops telfairi]
MPRMSKTPEQSQEKSGYLEDHSPENRCEGSEGHSVTELLHTVKEVSKMSIAHEIVVNQNFRVEEKILPPNSPEGKLTEKMYDAFWDHLREQLSSLPPDFTSALQLLKDVKEALLSLLLPRQIRLKNEIEENLDMDLLKQESEHGALDVNRLSNYILNLMIQLCAPIRDAAVKKLKDVTDPVLLLKGIFHVLGQMRVDMINYTIQNLRPYLQEHSIEYERAKFQELLNKKPSLLDHTTKWLNKATADVTASLSGFESTSSTSNSFETPTLTMVLYQGYLNLLLWDAEDDEFPETLLMDRGRLKEMAFQLEQLTVLASVLLVARSFSGNVLFNSPTFVDKLKSITKVLTQDFNSRPEEAMLSVSEQLSQEIHQGLEDMGLTPLSSDNTTSLIGQLKNIVKKDNCVRTVIDQRIRLFLKSCFIRGIQESLLDFPGGLILIKEELEELARRFVNLMYRNQQVFSPYYVEIFKNINHPVQDSGREL